METQDKASSLRRMKWFAAALLVAAAALFALAKSQHDVGVWAWVSSFAEAAMVGALADWFAVVALFRHPLGVPIPHTAILPANKARVADNLAVFVRDRFLGTDALVARVNAFDPASRLSAWLAEPKNADLLGKKAVTAVGQLVSFVDDQRIKDVLYDAIRRRAEQFDLAGAAGGVLSTLTEDRRHQLLLDEGLRQMAGWLDKPETQEMLAARVVAVAGEEYPKLVGMLGFVGLNAEELGAEFAAGLVRGANQWLHDISGDPEHERRKAFDAAVERFVERLKSDPAFKEHIAAHKRQWLERPELRGYVNGLWDEFTAWLEADLRRPDSALHAKVVEVAGGFAQALGGDPVLRDSINEHMRDALKALAPELREGIAKHIAATVKQWDDATLVRDVELNIGRDLQFIRVNGTLVGGAVGVLIHVLVVFVF
ncbi:putative membrane protein [Candidatus Burkholderia verschuerenii]|uniref:Putative membrane protein n=2 Tax=Candidatus Burkholderia verschuerenii TaxID=242163 RepID=A0A0L0MC90_9BURK|nr:putative membrane protein [Candidatus Burkholderia verschuerenii]